MGVLPGKCEPQSMMGWCIHPRVWAGSAPGTCPVRSPGSSLCSAPENQPDLRFTHKAAASKRSPGHQHQNL